MPVHRRADPKSLILDTGFPIQMKNRDIIAFILSEATGLEVADILLLLDGSGKGFLGESGLMEPVSRKKALMALALWNRKKHRLFDRMMQSPAEALKPEDRS